jgi:hypothetical protein
MTSRRKQHGSATRKYDREQRDVQQSELSIYNKEWDADLSVSGVGVIPRLLTMDSSGFYKNFM